MSRITLRSIQCKINILIGMGLKDTKGPVPRPNTDPLVKHLDPEFGIKGTVNVKRIPVASHGFLCKERTEKGPGP
jgi:hypothetical protein